MSNKEIDGEANGGEEEVKTDPPKEKVSQGEVEKIIDFLNSNTKYRVVTEEEFELLKGPQLKSTPKDTFPHKIQRPLQRRLLPSVADITHYKTDVPPVIGGKPNLPIFSGEHKAGEVVFDVWKYEARCVIREAAFPKAVILHSIRNSLRGKARSLLITIAEDTSPMGIIEKLDGVFGNVCDNEAVIENFYQQSQSETESVADYGMRLQSLIHVAFKRKQVSTTARDEMLCSKLFTGLRNKQLQSCIRYKYEQIKDFDKLLREVRSVEKQMGNSTPVKLERATVQQQSTTTIEDIFKKMDNLSTKVERIKNVIVTIRDGGNHSAYHGTYNFRRNGQDFPNQRPRSSFEGNRYRGIQSSNGIPRQYDRGDSNVYRGRGRVQRQFRSTYRHLNA